MKSRAHFKSHPLHPMLIPFPIAFLAAAPVGDLLGRTFEWGTLYPVGAYASVAGVVTGLVAAVPGLIDYLAVVPPDSSAKRRATYHMAVNATALVLVSIGFFFRDWDTLVPGWPTILLELAAVGLMTVGGWLGGTLVYRNQIGVDHRYAHAGKWHEHDLRDGSGESPVEGDGVADMKPGQMRLVHTDARRVVLARTDDGFTAFDDRCPHKGGPLSDGALACGTVQCPWHGSQFDAKTGQCTAGPADEGIPTYPATLRDGKVYVTLPPR